MNGSANSTGRKSAASRTSNRSQRPNSIRDMRKSAPVKPIRPSTRQSQRPKTTQRSTMNSLLDDPECNQQREALFENPNFEEYETTQLTKLKSHLKEYTKHCALNEEYAEAKKSRNLESLLQDELNTRGTYTKSIQELKDQQDRIDQEFEEAWQEKRDAFNADTDQRIQDLQDKHDHDFAKFERLWAEKMPDKYRKPSGRLLQLKQIEKSLALTGEIDQADFVHAEAERMQEMEMEYAQEILSRDYQIAKEKLLYEQNDEMQMLFDKREHERKILEENYIKEKTRICHRDFVVTTRCTNVSKVKHVSQEIATKPIPVRMDKGKPIGSLLPPLIPPNDPDLLERQRRMREEKIRKCSEYQKKNAETILKQYDYASNMEYDMNNRSNAKPNDSKSNVETKSVGSMRSDTLEAEKIDFISSTSDDEVLTPILTASKTSDNEDNEKINPPEVMDHNKAAENDDKDKNEEKKEPKENVLKQLAENAAEALASE